MTLEELRRALETLPDSASLTLSVAELRDVVAAAPIPPPAPPAHNVPPDKLLLDTSQTAEYLSMGVQTLAIWRLKGGGPLYVRLGRRVFYKKSDLETWIAERTYRHTAQWSESKRKNGVK